MKRQYDVLVRFSSVFTMVLVSIMIATKAWAWLASGSAAMLGSLTDSLLDITASMMSFLVLSYALRPADDDHRFGHGKAEALAGLGQAAFISGSACFLAFHGVERLINPVPLAHSMLGVWVSGFAILCTLLVVAVQQYVVKHTESIAVKADSLHYKGDLLLNAAVLVGIYLASTGYLFADSVFAIGVAFYLLFNCWEIAKESANHLMDKELPDEEKVRLVAIISKHPDVQGVHDLRTRQSGKLKFVQFHIELDKQLSLQQAHGISAEVCEKVRAVFGEHIDIMVHQDPVALNERCESQNP